MKTPGMLISHKVLSIQDGQTDHAVTGASAFKWTVLDDIVLQTVLDNSVLLTVLDNSVPPTVRQ